MEGRNQSKRKSLSNRLDEKSAEDILVNLPVKSLMRFKCVSKSWQSFIEDPSFIQLHLSRSKAHPQLLITFKDTDSVVVSSPEDGFKGGVALHKVKIPWFRAAMLNPIHGLFCLVDRSVRGTRIYNLGTGQVTPWAKTSIPAKIGASVVHKPSYGFGFDPLSNNYKVVCVWETYYSTSLSTKNPKGVEHSCEVFRVGGGGGNKWRKIDEVPPVRLFGHTGVYANGSIYWRNDSVISFFAPRDAELIAAFDVGTEKFRVIQIPDFIVPCPKTLRKWSSQRGEIFLLQIDGHMAVVNRVEDYVVKLWISDDDCYMEKKMTTNWTEETMKLPPSFQRGYGLDFNPVQGTDEIVIKSHISSTEWQPRGFISLYIYNRSMKTFREIEITGISRLLSPAYTAWYGMFIYHESLLPIENAEKNLHQPAGNTNTGSKMEEDNSQTVGN
ncbi:hypothetical protein MKW92_014353 [Papaver armeniacum]|nr:hypothetical protein MKW92_014353 [Papaver armeniacum]